MARMIIAEKVRPDELIEFRENETHYGRSNAYMREQLIRRTGIIIVQGIKRVRLG